MKKLLLVLLVVALASFLFVGCLPTTPAEGEGEGEGEGEVCPTVALSTEVDILGDKYIKGGSNTITVTFAEATEPVMSADADKKVYTGKYTFVGDYDCDTAYVYVATCTTCAPCKFPYTVDNAGPCSQVEVRNYPSTGCSCGGLNINFRTPVAAASCDTYGCCGDYCSGLDTYKFELYKSNPFNNCCGTDCASPIATCEGTGCDIDCTISCFDIADYYTYTTADYNTADEDFYLVVTLVDKVGNKTYYYATLDIDSKAIGTVTEYIDDNTAGSCTTWATGEERTDDIIGACAVGSTGVCGTVSLD